MTGQERISADEFRFIPKPGKSDELWFKWECRGNRGHKGWYPTWPDGTRCPKCGSLCSTYQRHPTHAQVAEWEGRQG